METIIRSVRPYGEGEPVDVRIVDGIIAAIGKACTEEAAEDATIIEGSGGVLLPGLVDIHVHLREPGREDTETIETGSRAAARGGFTAVFTMANTQPVTDQPILAEAVWAKGQAIGLCDVHPIGSITKNLEGKTLTEFAMMANSAAKVRMFSDDGKCVTDSLVMRRAAEYAAGVDVMLAQHAEDHRMTEKAVAHEGPTAARLGLAGWPRVAEESIVARDIMIARDYHARIHICHASTAGTVEMIRQAKSQGISVTSEAAPHHLLLDDAVLETYDGVFRVNPPLREKSDVQALRAGLLDGTIDVVATDHAPHAAEEKEVEFDQAKPGMLGLETSLAIIAELFVRSGLKDWRWLAKVMSERPAELVRLEDHGRPLAVGEPANLTVVADEEWTVERDELASKARNTPYHGHRFGARVIATVLRGRPTYQREAHVREG